MTQAFTKKGKRVPVTVVKAGPVVVTQVKKSEKDGYEAVQLGFGEKKIKKTTKPALGHLKGAIKGKKVAPRFLREAKGKAELKIGDVVTAEQVLSPGDLVKVSGISKGKGFAGVIKRWGFAGGPRTHGQSDRERAPGSIGQTTSPGRVWKGKKMAGRKGGKKATVTNLTVLDVDPDNGEVLLSGPIPGANKRVVYIEKVGKAKDFLGLARPGEEITPEAKEVQALPKEKEEGEEEKAQEAEAKPAETREEKAEIPQTEEKKEKEE